ncbi:prepilin-type N-terminal cleavage/methylation domain-containing protein [Massilia sp. W12]|uniref:prepilin-type N-terminal cleavage/methylation domain-containing protein n=1 Tax=Massilia sp. W12 TaxID=3126507 RepID=UPI0030CA8664
MQTGKRQAAFSLVEMAVVLVIVALLVGGLMMPLATQLEQQKTVESNKVLEAAREALIGYMATHGRLPCPASASSNGAESFASGGNASNGSCSNFYDGFLPAVTLGFHPVDPQGYALDGWGSGSINRIRYAVSNLPTSGALNMWTSSNGVRTYTLTALSTYLNGTPPNNNLITICRSNSTLVDCGGTSNQLTTQAPFLLYSAGKNAATPNVNLGQDEAQNTNGDTIFVWHENAARTATNGEFDDVLIWTSTSTLISRMLAAGSLP